MDEFYEGFRHHPSWSKQPDYASMVSTVADLRALSPDLQREAVIVDVGEANWPTHLVGPAIAELAALGRPLRALLGDLSHLPSGTMTIQQLAVAEEEDVEITRVRLTQALPLLQREETATVCWDTPPNS